MRTSPLSESLPLGSERFATNKRVISSLDAIKNAAAMLSDDVQSLTGDYDSLVVFNHTEGDSVATPVGHADAENIDPRRFEFRNTNVLNRAILLSGTGLGETLLNPREKPLIKSSRINHDSPQATFTHPLTHEGNRVGAVQLSFTASGKNEAFEYQPDGDEILNAWKRSEKEMHAIAAEMAHLQLLHSELGSLATRLEYDDPIAPNSFIVRWDIEGSKKLAASDQRRRLKAYINQGHLRIREIIKDYEREYDTQFEGDHIYDDQGDGANIILPIPSGWNTYNKSVRETYAKYTAEPFMNEVQSALQAIGAEYAEDLSPTVRIEGTFGFYEPNSIGRFTAQQMFELGAQKSK